MPVEARVLNRFSAIDRHAWERLDHRDNPFLSYTFLHGLEDSGSIGPESGWQPQHLALFEDGELLAFAPTYAKAHSHGEFVFDWAWADAYQRNGLDYYPKLLTGVPYTPVSGPRLLVRSGHPDAAGLKRQLVAAAVQVCRKAGYSSWHCNFTQPDDDEVLATSELLARRDWQFHWRNAGHVCFDDFLSELRSRKRKNILRERAGVRRQGIDFRLRTGVDITGPELEFVYSCYLDTFRNYGNYPALSRSFFDSLAAGLGEHFLVAFATRDDDLLAMALFLSGGGRLYGRYWGAREDVPGLHFETAYYQGIEYCIEHGLEVFESGAQGEHKIARGFLPTQTHSWHHVEHPLFRQAIADHLQREEGWVDEYREELRCKDPYRRDRS